MRVETMSFLSLLQYMIILFVVFVLQFSVSCVCLALNKDLQVGFHLLSSRSNSVVHLKITASTVPSSRITCWRWDGTNPRPPRRTWRKP